MGECKRGVGGLKENGRYCGRRKGSSGETEGEKSALSACTRTAVGIREQKGFSQRSALLAACNTSCVYLCG